MPQQLGSLSFGRPVIGQPRLRRHDNGNGFLQSSSAHRQLVSQLKYGGGVLLSPP
jgi:hypothetical protein